MQQSIWLGLRVNAMSTPCQPAYADLSRLMPVKASECCLSSDQKMRKIKGLSLIPLILHR